jgi:DNA modification methylase
MFDPTRFPVPTSGSREALLVQGDCRELLRQMPAGSVHCVVTSPPYWGLRDYGLPSSVWDGDPKCPHEWGPMERGRRADLWPLDQTSSKSWLEPVEREGPTGRDSGTFCVRCRAWRGCLGLEPRIDLFIEHLVGIFRQVRRVLRDDGTLWLNLGDCYANAPNGRSATATKAAGSDDRTFRDKPFSTAGELPAKNLVGIPWRIALALQADGWILRSDIVWAKPNCLPESVRDRPTKSHEYLFLLAKSPRYYYDADAIREAHTTDSLARARRNWHGERRRAYPGAPQTFRMGTEPQVCHALGRNKRTVWTIPETQLQLRADLTEEQRGYALGELLRRGLL